MEYLCNYFDRLKSHISAIYSILSTATIKHGYMEKWENDLNDTLELKEWYRLAHCQGNNRNQACQYRRLPACMRSGTALRRMREPSERRARNSARIT